MEPEKWFPKRQNEGRYLPPDRIIFFHSSFHLFIVVANFSSWDANLSPGFKMNIESTPSGATSDLELGAPRFLTKSTSYYTVAA